MLTSRYFDHSFLRRIEKGHLLVGHKLEAFLKVLDPADRTTGGGSASAIAGAMAGALAAMVAELSLNKEGMGSEVFYEEASMQGRKLSAALMQGSTEDHLAFTAVRDAFRLPKQSEEERAMRQQAIQAAWIQATQIPLANAERCAQILELVTDLEGRSNPNAASDLRCAAHLARAGLRGCLENVAINIPSIEHQATVEELNQRAQVLHSL
jgi:formiminotetrahydrofolate cyclodeaminase